MLDVVITGMGVIGPNGVGLDSMDGAVRAHQLPFSPWPASAAPPHPEALIATAGEYPRTRYFNERQLRLMDKAMCLSAFAAGQALEDAGFADGQAPDDTATLLGTMRAEQPSVFKFLQPLVQGRPDRINPAEFPQIARNISCGQIAIRFGLRGPSSVLASGSLASLEALSRAADFIRMGRSKVALVGGLDVLSKFSLYFSRRLYADSMAATRPSFFGTEPGYLIPSEGACLFVLESAQHAEARGARVHARLAGHWSGRVGKGSAISALTAAWDRALAQSGLQASDVGMLVISAAGGNRPFEQDEAAAVAAWLQERNCPAQVHAPRSLVGEGEAWTAALQVATAAYALKQQTVWPTWSVANDAPPLLAARSSGGPLQAPAALVTAIGSHGVYHTTVLKQA